MICAPITQHLVNLNKMRSQKQQHIDTKKKVLQTETIGVSLVKLISVWNQMNHDHEHDTQYDSITNKC